MEPVDSSSISGRNKVIAVVLLIVAAYTLGLFSSNFVFSNKAYRSKAAEVNPCISPTPYVSVYPTVFISGNPPYISPTPTPYMKPTSYLPTNTPIQTPYISAPPPNPIGPSPTRTPSACNRKCGYIGGVYYNQCSSKYEICVNNCCQSRYTQ